MAHNAEKDEIAVIFFEERIYEFLLVLSDGEWVPKEASVQAE